MVVNIIIVTVIVTINWEHGNNITCVITVIHINIDQVVRRLCIQKDKKKKKKKRLKKKLGKRLINQIYLESS